MEIFIPTYGRAANQKTYHNLPPAMQKITKLVVQHRERHLYDNYDILVLPPRIQTIAPTRHYIMQKMAKEAKAIMIDDDVKFKIRQADQPTKFKDCTAREVSYMFEKLERNLNTYAHAGVLKRFMANYVTAKYLEVGPMTVVLGYDVEVFRREKIRFDRLTMIEDHDVTLQLLRKGYPNKIECGYVHDPGAYGKPGGCSGWRTLEVYERAHEDFAKLHHPFVSLRRKKNSEMGGAEHYTAQVRWKQAYHSDANSARGQV